MADFIDMTQFRQAVREVLQDVRKDEVSIVNRAGLVAITGGKGVRGAIHRTPRASRAAIDAISPKVLAGVVIKKAKLKGEWPLTSAEIKKRIKKERSRRKSSIAYTAGPGWHKAAVAMGGRGVRGIQSGFAESKAAKGGGTKATVQQVEAIIENTAPAADLIGRPALQAALNDTARDMIQHARAKIGATLKRKSA